MMQHVLAGTSIASRPELVTLQRNLHASIPAIYKSICDGEIINIPNWMSAHEETCCARALSHTRKSMY